MLCFQMIFNKTHRKEAKMVVLTLLALFAMVELNGSITNNAEAELSKIDARLLYAVLVKKFGERMKP